MGNRVKNNNRIVTDLCPFQVIQDYVSMRGKRWYDVEQFFVFSDHSPVSQNQFRAVLHKALNILGLDSGMYNMVSLRSGHAIDLLNMNISMETIRQLGHWKSNVEYRYLKMF